MKIQSHNQLLEGISKIFENKEKLMRDPELLVSLKCEIESISSFLDLNQNFTPLFSVMICEQLMGEVNSLKKIMKHMGYSPLEIIKSIDEVKALKKRGWISISKRKFHSFKTDEFEISKMVLDAITYNDPSKLIKQKPENLAEALLQIRQIITNANGDYEFDEFVSAALSEIEDFVNFGFIASVLDHSAISDLEKLMLIWMASDVVFGREEFDLNAIIDFFTQDASNGFAFKQKILKGNSSLIKDGFLEFKRPNFVDLTSIKLGDRTNDLLFELSQHSDQNKKHTKYTVLLEPRDLKAQTLFFNASQQASVNKIDQLLDEHKYKSLMAKFQDFGMKDCLTILLHGAPGTGKTELVKQLALKHQRSIYQVDISSIKDMWVGESEKNMKKVFKEYAAALKYNRITPILLFNEADALLGLRTDVQYSVDQMNNSLQNILLQELEDMSGIFIATTNLIQNIDKAFDRRLLYKIDFEIPENKTRFKILKHQFPNFDERLLMKASHDHKLTGGQIQNIKRKLMADQLLFGEEINESELLLTYIENEMGFRRNGRKIGYV